MGAAMPPIRPDALERPAPARLAPGHPAFSAIMDRHAAALAAGQSSYRDPVSGLAVFTAAFLIRRRYCCESGCRHCPYVGA